MSNPVQHSAIMADRLVEQFKGLPGWTTLLDAIGSWLQDAEDQLSSFASDYNTRTTTNAKALETLGRVVDEARNGDDNDRFRLRILARTVANKSRGSIPDMYAVSDVLADGTKITEPFAHEVEAVLPPNTSVDYALVIDTMLQIAKGAGIALDTISTPGPDAFRSAIGTTMASYSNVTAPVITANSSMPLFPSEGGKIVIAPGTSDAEVVDYVSIRGNDINLYEALAATPDDGAEIHLIQTPSPWVFGNGTWGGFV